MKNSTLWIVVAIIIVLGLGWWLYSSMNQAPAPAVVIDTGSVAGADNQFVDNSKDGASATGASVGTPVTVTYSDAGFTPSTVTIKAGTSVTFVNTSSHAMWVASADHPTHTVYSGTSKSDHCPNGTATDFDQCATGTSYTFVFNKVGTWGYHNHVGASDKGTVIVTN